MIIVSFHEVDFSYDRGYLITQFESFRNALKKLIRPHLSEKSCHRVDLIMNFFTNPKFLDRFFATPLNNNSQSNVDYGEGANTIEGPVCDPIFKIRSDLIRDINNLLDRGRI